MTFATPYHRLGIVFLGLLACAGEALGCGGEFEGEIWHGEGRFSCEEDADCGFAPESHCRGSLCSCPNSNVDGLFQDPHGVWVCQPRRVCIAPEATSGGGGTGGAGGAGGTGSVAPASECEK